MSNGEYPVDQSTTLGQTRVLIPDFEPEIIGTEVEFIFSDETIQTFLTLNNDNPHRAAAQGVLLIASNEALQIKYVRTDDLLVDGVKVADFLRKYANDLLLKADLLDDSTEFFELSYFPIQTGSGKFWPELSTNPVLWWPSC